jgi:ATP synthase protein I
MSHVDGHRRGELGRAVKRDLTRLGRREGPKGFWRSLSLIGSVGWPIALLGAGGAIAGHWLDQLRRAGVRYTLLLLFVGIALGGAIAWGAIGEAK